MSEENKNISEMPEEEQTDSTESLEKSVPDADVCEPCEEIDGVYDTEVEPKPQRKVTLFGAVCSCVAICLAAVMLTYTLCSSLYQKKLADIRLDGATTGVPNQPLGTFDELELIKRIFEAYSFEELDEKQMFTAVLKAYVAATGDDYAEYYTKEEYDELVSSMSGESQGIGIYIINSTVAIGGYEYKALKVINVIKDSPAEKAGVLVGDYIVAVGTEKEHITFNELGYDIGLAKLQGVKGTNAEFIVCRKDGENVQIKAFSILRSEVTSSSVMSKVADASVDPTGKTGVVKIVSFDATTPTQFEAAVDALVAKGCDKFVFDVRYNLGGELTSVVAVLSYFLYEGDTVITVKDNKGNESTTKVAPVEYNDDLKCDVAKEDIGKYKHLNAVVLCNEDTASAAELFVANFRDHGIGKVVGVTTFGKGSVQNYLPLSYYGYDGVLKLTLYKYFPPCNVGYDGIGIEPHVKVEMSEAAQNKNIYEIMGSEVDNQLMEAVKHFK